MGNSREPNLQSSITPDIDDLILERIIDNIAYQRSGENFQEIKSMEIPWKHDGNSAEKQYYQLLDRRTEQLEVAIESQRTTICNLQENISQINANIKDLLSIYEFVSMHFNPFIKDNELNKPDNGHTPHENESQNWKEANNGENSLKSIEPNYSEEGPLLVRIPKNNQLSHVIILRWLEFLLQRVKREKIPPLFDYYIDINWISEDIKNCLLTFMRGEVPDIVSYEPDEEQFDEVVENLNKDYDWQAHINPKNADEWRLSAEDHLKSYLFIQRILGNEIDLKVLNQIERELESIQGNLKKYHGL